MLTLCWLAVLAADARFVAASTANMRAQPDAKAAVVTRLTIGAEVAVQETKGDWVRVQQGGKEGWVLGELLDKEKPTLESMTARLEATKKDDVAGRRKWAERAAALAPGDVAVLARLVEILRSSGDRVALEQARMGLARARAKAGVVSVAATHLYLLYDKTGDASDCLNENPELTRALWNTIIGEGSSGGSSTSMALKIEVYGPPGPAPAGAMLEVDVLEGERVKVKKRMKLGRFDAKGESRYEVKVKDTGCNPLTIKARIAGGEPNEVEDYVGFDCGE